MARLLIQFVDEELADFRWALIDETAQSADIDWQPAAEDELGRVASQNPHPVIMVLSQQSVYLSEVELPERASRQVLSTIDYQVEDQLARDIETQHVALADGNANQRTSDLSRDLPLLTSLHLSRFIRQTIKSGESAEKYWRSIRRLEVWAGHVVIGPPRTVKPLLAAKSLDAVALRGRRLLTPSRCLRSAPHSE